jgi:uncharacterized membrane protein YtjA (UPF0391 family)
MVASTLAVVAKSSPLSTPMQAFSGEFIELAVLFFVLALVAALFGARGIAGVSMTIAKWFVVVFLVLAVVSLVF